MISRARRPSAAVSVSDALDKTLTRSYGKIIFIHMKFSRGFRRMGMVPAGLFLAVLLVTWFIPCHVDGHTCEGSLTQGSCCCGHSVPLVSADGAGFIVTLTISNYHIIEEQSASTFFPASIFRPPRA
jgi:hypothetical protein